MRDFFWRIIDKEKKQMVPSDGMRQVSAEYKEKLGNNHR